MRYCKILIGINFFLISRCVEKLRVLNRSCIGARVDSQICEKCLLFVQNLFLMYFVYFAIESLTKEYSGRNTLYDCKIFVKTNNRMH